MKKTKFNLFLIIILCLIFAITGCSKKEESADSSDKHTTNTTTDSGDKKTGISTPGAVITDSSISIPESESAKTDGALEAIDGGFYSDDVLFDYATSGEAMLGEAKVAFDVKEYSATGDDFIDPETPYEPVEPVRPQVSAGTLTAGEWNDNKNFDFLKKLVSDGQNYDYTKFFTDWDLSPFSRLVINCVSNDTPVSGANVTVTDPQGNPIWKGVTDHEGKAYAYYALADADMMPAAITAEYNGSKIEYSVTTDDLSDSSVIDMNFEDYSPKAKTLDLMFTIDTTGSMGDEIYYLQKELENVIKRVQADTSNIPTRLSVNFYRDHGDDYVVRPYEFSTDINTQLAYLSNEYANGGGDFEEAVELALESSVFDHSWDDDSIKLLFLVLDAPPHNTDTIKESLKNTISKASEMGIRIIPVASSGIDKNTEFLLRTFAMTTGGTYTFLTDHSGVGGSHIEPTIGDYDVEFLNDLLVRLIEEYIG